MYIAENHISSESALLPENNLYFSDLKPAVIDIETTGLSSARDRIFLIGVLSQDEEGLKITQFLASDYDEEPDLLQSFFDFTKHFELFLNYNGSAFDIPFINKRSGRLRLNRILEPCRSVDYLRIFKASYLPELLPNLKLKTVEQFAGIRRKDTISGKDCISLFEKFARTNDKEAGRKLLLHNYEDLSCFPCLNRIIGKIDLHSALNTLGFPVKTAAGIFFVQSVKTQSGLIKAAGAVPDCKMDWMLYEEDFTLLSDSKTKTFTLDIRAEISAAEPRVQNLLIRDTLQGIRF